MPSIQDMREDRDRLAKQARDLVEKKGAYTSEDDEKFNQLVGEMDKLDARIATHQKFLDQENEALRADKGRADRSNISLDEAHAQGAAEKGMFLAWARGGMDALTRDQMESVRTQQRQATQVFGALSVGTDSAGGFTVPTDFTAQILARMKAFGGVRAVAQTLQTDHGRDIEYPTTDATSELGELIAENGDSTELDASFGVFTLKAYKYSSKFIHVPFELLQDTRIDLEAHLMDRLATRIGRITGAHHTTGTNSSQPQGVVTAAGTVAAAAAAAIAYEDLIDLQHAIDPAYRMTGRMRFMLNDAVLKVIRKLKDSEGRPLWMPNIGQAVPATLLGDEYVINQHMVATVATTNKTVLYGDFANYMVRDVMQVQLFRFTDSVFIKKGQVGFLAWYRGDGRVMAHTAADVMKVLTQA